MDHTITIEEGERKNVLELVKSASHKHLDRLRPSARYYSIFKGQGADATEREKGKYTLIRDPDDFQPGMFDKPLPCFGCGVGWFSQVPSSLLALFNDTYCHRRCILLVVLFHVNLWRTCTSFSSSFLVGFLWPLMWYYATILYFGNYYKRDPRERPGLAASAIAALGCSVVLLIVILVLLF